MEDYFLPNDLNRDLEGEQNIPRSLRHTPIPQLTSLHLQLGEHAFVDPIELHTLLNVLGHAGNLELLSIIDIIYPTTNHHGCREVSLPHLKSLRLVANGKIITSLLEHLSFPNSTTLNIELPSCTASIILILIHIEKILKGKDGDTPQTLKGLSIRPSIDSLVVTGYHLRPRLRDLRSSQLNGSIRLCIKILGPDLDATYITVQFIRQCLPISRVEMVYLGDTICTQLNMIFLDLTIRDMPNLRFLYWAYVNRDEADDTNCMNSVIAFGTDSTHYSEMDAVLEYVRYYVDIDEYYKHLGWMLSSCEKRGRPVQGLRLEQLDPQDDSKAELQIECNTGYNWRTAWLYV